MMYIKHKKQSGGHSVGESPSAGAIKATRRRYHVRTDIEVYRIS